MVHGMRGVGGVCEMCMCLAQGSMGGEGVSALEDWAWASPILCEQGAVSPYSLCRCQVQESVYYARQIPAHLRCTQCSILLHLIDICFIPCICL